VRCRDSGGDVDRFGGIVFFRGENQSLGTVVDVQEFSGGVPGPPGSDAAQISPLGLDVLADEGGNDMAGLEIEVISRSIEVDREEEDPIEAVLFAVALEHDEERFFGDAVGGVGLFGEPVPEVFFLKRDGRKFRIGADGPDLDELFEASQSGLVDEVRPHHQVGVKETARILAIGSDSSDFGSEVQDEIGTKVIVHPADGVAVGEIIFLTTWDEDLAAASRAEFVADAAPEETCSSGHDDPSLRQVQCHVIRPLTKIRLTRN